MKKLVCSWRGRWKQLQSRHGSVLLLATGVLVLVLSFAAFSVDVGYIALTKTQLQNAADAAALAAAMELNPSDEQTAVALVARQAAVDVAGMNRAGDKDSVYVDFNNDIQLGRRSWDAQSQTYSREYGPTAIPYNIVKVTARRTNETYENTQGGLTSESDRRLPLFFAPILGYDNVALETTAVATFQPRDMVLVLDYSASMNDDSELASINSLGHSAVTNNIRQMWEDLGSPIYGNMGFEPEYVTFEGQPASGPVPHIEVTWKGTEIYVKSTKDLSNVVLEFDNGSKQKFDGLSGKTGTFKGTGSYSGKYIDTCWIKSGSNSSYDGPGYGERFDITISSIREALGLNSVPYPGESGSWDVFIHYCKSHSSSMPHYERSVYDAGYRRKFGALCLIDMWNTKYPMNSETSFLWQASQQPITALKNSVDLLLNYLTEVEAEDKVGLSVYTYPNSAGAKLESSLTTDFELIKTLSRQRQAGHYDHYTNIGAGMRTARLELENNARARAFRMMVLMTDGNANRSSTSASPSQFALDEADLAADSHIRIMTISLGVGADTYLMQQIADRTGGIHFNVPGGSGVAQYEEELRNVFAEIAADRPLKLIRDSE